CAGGRRSRALPIRTLTVGPGVPPGQPRAEGHRVADCHRRLGISPTPVHASCISSSGHTVAGRGGRMTRDERRLTSAGAPHQAAPPLSRRPPADLLPFVPHSTSISLHPTD